MTRADAQAKIAQELVQYQEKLKGQQECDNCVRILAEPLAGPHLRARLSVQKARRTIASFP